METSTVLDYQRFYRLSIEYLVSILPENIKLEDLDKYFIGDASDFSTLTDVFVKLIGSAQNYQGMPKTIKFYERNELISDILFDFNYNKIKDLNETELFTMFKERIEIKNAESKLNSWLKWSKSVIDSAKFISRFRDVDEFREFMKLFNNNYQTRVALPLLIANRIRGIGFALACDFLKELGYLEYAKPDTHIIKVFSELGFSSEDDLDVFDSIVLMAEACKAIDPSVTPYKIDKIIWLICSGYFYHDDTRRSGKRKEFIEYVESKC